MMTARDRAPRRGRGGRRLRGVLVLAALAVAGHGIVLGGPAAYAQPNDAWVPAQGLTVSAEMIQCGSLDGSGGEAVITVTPDDPEQTWGYAVRGATLDIASPASDNAGPAEIPILAVPGNYFVAAFQLPENGQTPVVTTGFTIEPCAPGPSISVSTTCAAAGDEAIADSRIADLAPGSGYRHRFVDAGGATVGEPVEFTADASGVHDVASVSLADDAAYRGELDWLPPTVPDPGWPTGEFEPATALQVATAGFSVGTCPPPAAAPAAPAATVHPGARTLAESGPIEAGGWLAAGALTSVMGVALLAVVAVGRRRRAPRADV